MADSQHNEQEIIRVQKDILALLNAKPDNRATSKELIGSIRCAANIFCLSIKLLDKAGFIKGPEFNEAMVLDGGSSNFRDSVKLTEAGQEKYIEMIRDEQA